MSEMSNLFDRNLILFDVDGETREEVFANVAKVLKENDYVEDTYLNALNEREDGMPTGVVTANLPIALPHANPENVKRPFVAVVSTKNPINVKTMGYGEDEQTQNFFFLGIVMKTQQLQVQLLQRFMELMNDEDFVKEFKSINNSEDMYQLFKTKF